MYGPYLRGLFYMQELDMVDGNLKTQTLEIYKTLVVSSSHLSEGALELIDPFWRGEFMGNNPRVSVTESVLYLLIDRTLAGWRVYINMEDETPEEIYARYNAAGLPVEFIALVKLGVNQGCRYIEFHMDGPVLEGFPRYDW